MFWTRPQWPCSSLCKPLRTNDQTAFFFFSKRWSPKNSEQSFELGFQDTGRNKKSIRQRERRGRENVIDWDEDLGCLAVLNLSLPLVPKHSVLCRPFLSTFIYCFLQPPPPPPLLFFPLLPLPTYFSHFLFSLSFFLSPKAQTSYYFFFVFPHSSPVWAVAKPISCFSQKRTEMPIKYPILGSYYFPCAQNKNPTAATLWRLWVQLPFPNSIHFLGLISDFTLQAWLSFCSLLFINVWVKAF